MTDGATSLQAPAPPVVTPTRRQRAEPVVRRLLVLPQTAGSPVRVSRDQEAATHRLFNFSMALSGLRCLLSYVLLPVVTPAIGAAAQVGPMVGIPIAAVALVFDVMAVRRFWAAQHRWRWKITLVYAAVMTMVFGLLVSDIVHLAS